MIDTPSVRHRPVAGDVVTPGNMTDIITGTFEQQPEAQQALADLFDAGFSKNQLTMFFVEPAAARDTPTDGTRLPPVDKASKGAATGAAIGGALGVAVAVAAAPVLGPAAVALGGVGPYVGSFAGGVTNIKNKNEPNAEVPGEALPERAPRKVGSLIAVAAASVEQQNRVLEILRAYGATDLERTEGSIVEGVWTDYDPTRPPDLLESTS